MRIFIRWFGAIPGFRVFIVCVVIAGLAACNNSEELGIELAAAGDLFNYRVDTTTHITVSTLRQDSLTSERRSAVLLGSLNDPVFGRSSASMMTQFRLSSNNVDFGDDIVVDSVRLLLKYKSCYGDTTEMLHVQVYELQQDLYYDSTYYSNLDPAGYYQPGQPVGSYDFLPSPAADSLIIPLSDDLGYKILTADTGHLADNDVFLEYFKGLYLKTDPAVSQGSVCYFDLAGGKSRLILYYQNSLADSLSYEVMVNNNCTWLSLFSHDYDASQIASQINDSAGRYADVYLQAMAGLRGHIRFEFGDTLLADAASGIAVNKAELILPVDEDLTADAFLRPSALRVYYAQSDGTNDFIDDILLGADYHGGFYHETEGVYTFNITRHIQNLLHPDSTKQKTNNGLFLTVDADRVTANRLILKNGNPADGIRLKIVYSHIK